MGIQPDRLLTKRMNPFVMKSVNAIELLELLRQHGRMSRSALARLSQLSKPTVSDQIDALIARGLVSEVGTGKSSARGGKRPTLLEFNSMYGRIIGVDIGAEWIRFAASDLVGAVLRTSQLRTQPERGARAVVDTIKRGVSELIEHEKVSKRSLCVISVAAPGIVDTREGIVLESENVFGWRDLRLGPELKAAFGLPVHVDNDVNMAALAELHAEGEDRTDNFVLIRLSTGIGAGIVLGGKVHHGAHWAAGEIGHMMINADAGLPTADPRGYLESVVGIDRVADRVRKISGERTLEAAAAERGDWSMLHDMVDSLVLHLGTAVANISCVYDPDAVILLGTPFPSLLERIRTVADSILPWSVDIRLSNLGDDASLQGALGAGLTGAYAQISSSLHSDGAGELPLAERFSVPAVSNIS